MPFGFDVGVISQWDREWKGVGNMLRKTLVILSLLAVVAAVPAVAFAAAGDDEPATVQEQVETRASVQTQVQLQAQTSAVMRATSSERSRHAADRNTATLWRRCDRGWIDGAHCAQSADHGAKP